MSMDHDQREGRGDYSEGRNSDRGYQNRGHHGNHGGHRGYPGNGRGGRGGGRRNNYHQNNNRRHSGGRDGDGDEGVVTSDGSLATSRYPTTPTQGGGGRGRGRGHYSGNRMHSGNRKGRGRFYEGPRLPGNIRERHDDDPMPPKLEECAKMLKGLGDASGWQSGDESRLVDRVCGAATFLIVGGHTREHLGDDLSNLFVKCLGHLPVQVPLVTTVLSLLNTITEEDDDDKDDDESPSSFASPHMFVEVVVQKLCVKLEHCLHEANVPKAKLLLRSLACLASAGTLSCVGEGGFVSLLENLFNALQPQMAGAALSLHNIIVVYLLTATLPWCVGVLAGCAEGTALLGSIVDYCDARVLPSTDPAKEGASSADGACYSSAFAVGGKHATFFVNCMSGGDDGGAELWDTLQRQCVVVCRMVKGVLEATAGNGGRVPASAIEIHTSMYMLQPWAALKPELAGSRKFFRYDDGREDSSEIEDGKVVQIALAAVMTQATGTGAGADAADDSMMGAGDSAAPTTGSLTAQGITDFLLHGLITHRPDAEYVCEENRTTRDRNPPTGAWLSLICPVYDAERSAPHAAGTDPSATASCMRCLTAADRMVLSDYIRDIVVFFEPYIRADGTYVGTTTTLAQQLLNIYKLYPVYIGIHGSSPTASLGLTPVVQAAVDYLVVETLFQMMVQLPAYNPLCLHRVLLELCRISPVGMPRIVASGCIELYQLAPAMDTAAWKAVTSWLSFHLVNFKLIWPYWEYWAQEFTAGAEQGDDEMAEGAAAATATAVTVAENDVSKAFILDLVDKCSRLSFPTAMRAALPAALHQCIPQQDVSSNVATAVADNGDSGATAGVGGIKPPLRFVLLTDVSDGESSTASESAFTPLQRVTNQLYRRMSSRTFAAAEVEEWLDEQFFDDVQTQGDSSDAELWKCCALVECSVFIGGGGITLSGLAGALDKYLELLRSYAYNVDNGQQAMLDTLYNIYGASQDWGLFDILLDMLLRRNVVTALVAAQWLAGSATGADIGSAAVLSTEAQLLPSGKKGGLLGQISNVCKAAGTSEVGHPWVWSHVETVVMRSFDFVSASLAKKEELQAEISSLKTQISNAGTEEEEDDDRQQTKRRRRGREEDEEEEAAGGESAAGAMEDDAPASSDVVVPSVPLSVLRSRLSTAESTLEIVTNSLVLSVQASQDIFAALIGSLLALIDGRCRELVGMESEEEDGSVQLDAVFVTLLSALKMTLRRYEHNQTVLNCSASAAAGEYELARRGDVTKLDLPVLAAGGEQGNATVIQVWESFA